MRARYECTEPVHKSEAGAWKRRASGIAPQPKALATSASHSSATARTFAPEADHSSAPPDEEGRIGRRAASFRLSRTP